MSKTRSTRRQYVVCVRNDGYEASLELRKIYRTMPDTRAARHGMTRVVDESGEDYLYPSRFFLAVTLPDAVRRALARAG